VPLAISPPPAGRWTARGWRSSASPGCVSDALRRNGLRHHLVRTYKVNRFCKGQ
jgi:hypothetical protein